MLTEFLRSWDLADRNRSITFFPDSVPAVPGAVRGQDNIYPVKLVGSGLMIDAYVCVYVCVCVVSI